jgi:uncharacterized protein YndB with AHSA1/START domain
MDKKTTDRIEKNILLRAPRSRVWRALTDTQEFGTWFRAKLDGKFEVGKRIRGQITYPGYEHLSMDVTVEKMEAEKLFSYRWHPGATQVGTNYDEEPTTLVEFHLEDEAGGTRLTIVESGFDRLPRERRDEAFRSNDQGWTEQLKNIQGHVES